MCDDGDCGGDVRILLVMMMAMCDLWCGDCGGGDVCIVLVMMVVMLVVMVMMLITIVMVVIM